VDLAAAEAAAEAAAAVAAAATSVAPWRTLQRAARAPRVTCE